MEVIVGTYEELVLGYKLEYHEKKSVLKTVFTDHSHTGCVRCVAISENGFLASGSSDESIKLFNLKKRTEVGALVHHNGYISSLAFFGKSHLFSCSADGTIGIWRVGKWECEKILRGHKDAVLSVSVHPTGKMALSISHNKMRTWNLLTGKCAYITHIKNGEIVRWSPDGEMYIVVSRDVVHIYSTLTAEIISSPKFDFRINCVHFIMNHVLVVGGEGGNIHFYNLKKNSQVHQIDTGTIRVKDMGIYEEEGKTKLVTGSSDGYIKVWNVTQLEGKWKTTLEASVDTKFRIISLAVRPSVTQSSSSKATGSVKLVQQTTEDSSEHDDSESPLEESDSDEEMDEDSSDISDGDKNMDDVEEENEGEEEEEESGEEDIPETVSTKGKQSKHKNSHSKDKDNRKGKKQLLQEKLKEMQKKNSSENNSSSHGKKAKNTMKNLQKKKQQKKLKFKGSKHKKTKT